MSTTTNSTPITLTLAERHTLSDLVESFLHDRAWEGAKSARYSLDLEAAADKLRRLAALKALAESDETLPADIDLDALCAELTAWGAETTDTVDEHDALIADELSFDDREGIAALWKSSARDYAHQCVCERIVDQIETAREKVPA